MFLLGLPFSPIRTRRLPKRAASPAQNPCAGFRNTGQGVSLHRGPSALPRKDRLKNSLITISIPPCQALSSFSLAGSDRKSTRLNSSHLVISYAVFCLKKKKNK